MATPLLFIRVIFTFEDDTIPPGSYHSSFGPDNWFVVPKRVNDCTCKFSFKETFGLRPLFVIHHASPSFPISFSVLRPFLFYHMPHKRLNLPKRFTNGLDASIWVPWSPSHPKKSRSIQIHKKQAAILDLYRVRDA